MRGRDERAEVGGRVARVTEPHRAHQLGHAGDEVVDQRAVDDGPGRGRAVLAGVDQRRRPRRRGPPPPGRRRPGRRTAPCRRARGAPASTSAAAISITRRPDAAGAGERHHVDVRVRPISASPATGPEPVSTLTTPSGMPGVRAGLGEHQRGQRGELARLEHDRVAGGDGRQDLPGRHLQRVVPRGDRPDDADRLAAYGRGVVRRVLAGGPALQGAGRAGEERRVVDRARARRTRGPAGSACRSARTRSARATRPAPRAARPAGASPPTVRRGGARPTPAGPPGPPRPRRRRPPPPASETDCSTWPFAGSTMSCCRPDEPARADAADPLVLRRAVQPLVQPPPSARRSAHEPLLSCPGWP